MELTRGVQMADAPHKEGEAKIRKPLDKPLEAQRLASDERVNVWVKANAGSGKTFVLALRVLRLLLGGTSPSAILCLTYTRTAAAEMQNRVFKRLADWAICDEAALRQDIGNLLGRPAQAQDIINGRRLFARAIETPGGLKIQTIHAFAERLLHQFPLEAGVPPGFEMIDEQMSANLMQEARRRALEELLANTEGGDDIALMHLYGSEQGFEKALDALIAERSSMARLKSAHGGYQGILKALAAHMEINPQKPVSEFADEILSQSIIPQNQWEDLAAILHVGTDADKKKASKISSLRGAKEKDRRRFWQDFFLTQKLEPRKSLISSSLLKQHPDWDVKLGKEQERLLNVFNSQRRHARYHITRVLIALGETVLAHYEGEKRARGLLDFQDLIEKTAAMLSRLNMAWVLYKLDMGVDHVLLDEAQDTSESQWAIIGRMVDEFFAGEGARGRLDRTLFVVGDEKQSIYSFQGAAPKLFGEMRRHYERASQAAEKPWREQPLNTSFRTVSDVLSVVDKVFEGPAVVGLMSDPADGVTHTAQRKDARGFVELWPLEPKGEKADEDPWDAPVDKVSAGDAQLGLANRIARTISRWLKEGMALPSHDRPVAPGDILILVRFRSRFFDAVLKALKREGVPVAGADRLVLSEHIAVEDLIAAARFVLLPQDDLSLAEVLKSPLFDLDDNDLMHLAIGRRGSLFQSLQAAEAPKYVKAHERLSAWLKRADFLSPYHFFAEILLSEGGIEAFLGRLGKDAEEPIGAFLDMALDYSGREAATLSGFISWFEATTQTIKRDMEQGVNAVRIMTVHGAKGLEAPIVFLADTTRVPDKSKKSPLVKFAETAKGDVPPLFAWNTKATETEEVSKIVDQLLQADFEEYHRLLYVAMTRAADGLIICGAEDGRSKLKDNAWYARVRDAIKAMPHDIRQDEDGRDILIHGVGLKKLAPIKASYDEEAPLLPSFITTSLPQKPFVRRFLSPSSAWVEEAGEGADQKVVRRAKTSQNEGALLRGSLTHALFQYLPSLDAPLRAPRARAFLEKKGKLLGGEVIEAVLKEVFSVLEHPDFIEVFNPRALVEAPLIGTLSILNPETGEQEEVVISGIIDRLIRLEDRWLIVDYKTDARVPETASEVAEPYLMQMALYKLLIARLGGPSRVDGALLYTRAPSLISLDGDILEKIAAKQGIS